MIPSTNGLVVPEMLAEHYGVPCSHFGEDGDIIALGHHSPRTALAAFRKHARVDIGLDDEETFGYGFGATSEDLMSNIVHTYATFKGNSDGEWWGMLGKTAAVPGALPVTIYRSWA